MGTENEIKFETSSQDLQKLAAARILRRKEAHSIGNTAFSNDHKRKLNGWSFGHHLGSAPSSI
jgi:hypothetical protein